MTPLLDGNGSHTCLADIGLFFDHTIRAVQASRAYLPNKGFQWILQVDYHISKALKFCVFFLITNSGTN